MANNKVQLANGTVLIDLTDTTATASDVLSGEYFYDAAGVKTEGSLSLPSGTYTITSSGTYDITNYAYVEVDIDMWTEQTISTTGAVSQTLSPFVIYHFTGAITSLTITLGTPASGQLAHYHFDFLSGSTAATLSMPQTVEMPDNFVVESNNRYEVDILNNYGTVTAWQTS